MKPSAPRPEPLTSPSSFAVSAAGVTLLSLSLLPVTGADAQSPPAERRPLFAAAAPTPAPAAATPAPDAAEKAETTETEIVATQGADFDSRARVASFKGAVHVADPRFELWCDQLTVYLNKAADKPPAGGPPPAAGEKREGEAGGIDRAVAEGNVVIVQRKALDKDGRALPETGNAAGNKGPKTSIGRAERAEFKNRTGEMTLSGSPRVQQDLNELVGGPGTVMVLGRDSTLKTIGASRTVIRQKPADADNVKKEKTPAVNAVPDRRRG